MREKFNKEGRKYGRMVRMGSTVVRFGHDNDGGATLAPVTVASNDILYCCATVYFLLHQCWKRRLITAHDMAGLFID